MIYLFMLLKTVAWLTAFFLGIRRGWKEMLLWAGAISVILTVADKLIFAGIVSFHAVLLTFLLYALMSVFLLSLAWKLQDPAVSLACNVMGTLGAFAVINFMTTFLKAVFAL